MTWPAIAVEAHVPAREALATLEETDLHFLPVVSDGYLLGMTCRCRLVTMRGSHPVIEGVPNAMISVGLATSLREAAATMRDRAIECLPVSDEGHLFGVLTLGDLVRAGALDEDDRPICAACRARRHLARGVGDVAFCADCMARSLPWRGDEYEELGGGD